MAKFDVVIPSVLMKEFDLLYNEYPKVLDEVLEAGGKVGYETVKANAPSSFRGSNIMNRLKITRVYRTLSDDAVNIKVGFYGYFVNHNNERVPAPLVANIFEYGSTKFQKRPFFRKSMRNQAILNAMLRKEQELLSKIAKE